MCNCDSNSMTDRNDWRAISDKPTEGDATTDDGAYHAMLWFYKPNEQPLMRHWSHWEHLMKNGYTHWHKIDTPPPCVVKYRDPVLPQDAGKFVEFLDADGNRKWSGPLYGFVDKFWVDISGRHYPRCRIPVSPEGEAGAVDQPSAPVPELPDSEVPKCIGRPQAKSQADGGVFVLVANDDTSKFVRGVATDTFGKQVTAWTNNLKEASQFESPKEATGFARGWNILNVTPQPIPAVDTSDKRVDAETQPESRPFNETIDRAEANGVLKLRDNQWMFWAGYGFLTPTEMRPIADELESRDRGQG